MRFPSEVRLLGTFRDLTLEQARLMRKLAHNVDDREVLSKLIDEFCPNTSRSARACHSDPYNSGMWRRTMLLRALDEILGTHGVEALGKGNTPPYAPPYEYLNTGDPYAVTLIYTKKSDTISIGCWGDIAERYSGRQLGYEEY